MMTPVCARVVPAERTQLRFDMDRIDRMLEVLGDVTAMKLWEAQKTTRFHVTEFFDVFARLADEPRLRPKGLEDPALLHRGVNRLAEALLASQLPYRGTYASQLVRFALEVVLTRGTLELLAELLRWLVGGGLVRDLEAWLAPLLPGALTEYPRALAAILARRVAGLQLSEQSTLALAQLLSRGGSMFSGLRAFDPNAFDRALLQFRRNGHLPGIAEAVERLLRTALHDAAHSPLGPLRLLRIIALLEKPDDLIDSKLRELGDIWLLLPGRARPEWLALGEQVSAYLDDAPTELLRQANSQREVLLRDAERRRRTQRREALLRTAWSTSADTESRVLEALRLLGDDRAANIVRAVREGELGLALLTGDEFEKDYSRSSFGGSSGRAAVRAYYQQARHGSRPRMVLRVPARALIPTCDPTTAFDVLVSVVHEFIHHCRGRARGGSVGPLAQSEIEAHLGHRLWSAQHGVTAPLQELFDDRCSSLALHLRDLVASTYRSWFEDYRYRVLILEDTPVPHHEPVIR